MRFFLLILVLYIMLSCIQTTSKKSKKNKKCEIAYEYLNGCSLELKNSPVDHRSFFRLCDIKVAEDIIETNCERVVKRYLR